MQIAAPDSHQPLLEPLSLLALRLSRDMVRELNRVGFKTIGCLVDLPRAPLAARFGDGVLNRLDQALGRKDETISPIQPVAELVSEKRFSEPICYEDDIKRTIELLAENIVCGLETRGLGMRQCELVLFRADGELTTLKVAASNALRDAKRITRLFDERLAALHDEWDAGFGFDVIRLSILRADTLNPRQQDMVAEDDRYEKAQDLVDRLSARLGADRVCVYKLADTHIPERRTSLAPAITAEADQLDETEDETATRPVLLLNQPEPAEVIAEVPEGPPIRFRWRKAHYEVSRSEGPERIACEWWKDGRSAHTRDYFRIETAEGHRLWVFRQGLYARETNAPRWYVHGMFG